MNQPLTLRKAEMIRPMTEQEEQRDKRIYTLTTIVVGTIKQTKHEDYVAVHDLAERTSDLLIESGMKDWAVFVEDQHRLQYHHEWRNGSVYHWPDAAVNA